MVEAKAEAQAWATEPVFDAHVFLLTVSMKTKNEMAPECGTGTETPAMRDVHSCLQKVKELEREMGPTRVDLWKQALPELAKSQLTFRAFLRANTGFIAVPEG